MKRLIKTTAVLMGCASILLFGGCRSMNPDLLIGTRNTVINIEGGTNYITNTPSGGSQMGQLTPAEANKILGILP